MLVTLRQQVTCIIALLAFLPNLAMLAASGAVATNPDILLWIAVSAGASVGLAWLITGLLLRPLIRLRQEVENGSVQHPAEIRHHDPSEILSLRVAFLDLLGSLGTEQSRRNAFMATLVHDLKTPLIAIGHSVQILRNDLPTEEKEFIVQSVMSENRRLLALVAQMADAHRFEREDVAISPALQPLFPLLIEVSERLQPLAEAYGKTLSVSGESKASFDAQVLGRALTNLSENALRYAESAVWLHAENGAVLVVDDGPGLQESLENLAQPFNSQPTFIAGEQYTAGTAGLGLFIARRVAEAHGGHLRFKREMWVPAGKICTQMRIELPPVAGETLS